MTSPLPTSPHLVAEDLSLGYDDRTVVESMELAVASGRITTLIGPNACGKSTLLRGLARLLSPRTGRVLLDGREIHQMPTREVARRLALLPQQCEVPEGLTVRELAAFGRHPHQGWTGSPTGADDRIVEQAIADVGLVDLAAQAVDRLSGGQRQRAWLAMALAQEAEILLLDEPITFLDPAHQWEVLSLVRRLNRDHGRTVVMVLHDLDLAARFSDSIAIMREGKLVSIGSPAEVLTSQRIAEVYAIAADVQLDSDGALHVIVRGLL